MSAHVGAMQVDLHLPEARSLKGRRAIVNKARAALRRDLDVSVAQVDDTERWDRATLAVAVVASSPAGVDRVLDRVVAVIERDPRVRVIAASASHVGMEIDDAPDLPTFDPRVGGDGLSADDEALLAEWGDEPG